MEIKEILRITLAQVDLVWENPEQNRLNFEVQIRQLSGKSDLVILPETFTTGFSMRARDLAEPMDGPTVNWLLSLSRTTGLALGGSLIIKENGLYSNRFVFVTPGGDISHYDKRHLFTFEGESVSFTAGNKKLIVNFHGWRIAFYICYDVRFPVWCRNVNDTDLMIFTANWPASRNEVWKTLLKARAIENQVYVAGANRIGKDGNGISYVGESQVLNSRGELLLAPVSGSDGFFTCEISIKELNDFRAKFPVAKDADQFSII